MGARGRGRGGRGVAPKVQEINKQFPKSPPLIIRRATSANGIVSRFATRGSTCFICNTLYQTTVHTIQSENSKARVRSLCALFKIQEDSTKEELLNLAFLNEAFCFNCSMKLKNFSDLNDQLELIASQIEKIKNEVGRVIVQSFPFSPAGGTFGMKSTFVHLFNSTFKDEISSEDIIISSSSFVPEVLEITEHELEGGVLEVQEYEGDEESQIIFLSADDVATVVTVNNTAIIKPIVEKIDRKRKRSVSTGKKAVVKKPRSVIPAARDGHCTFCPSIFSNRMQLAKHVKRSHSGITFPCRHCKVEFKDTSNRKRHELAKHINIGKLDYICKLCNKGFSTPDRLRTHDKFVHKRIMPKQYQRIPSQCHNCGRVCPNERSLKRHLAAVHEGKRPSICHICGRPCKDAGARRKHLYTHMSTEERTGGKQTAYFYKCPHCSDEANLGGYTAKKQLMEHVKAVHPDIKGFQFLETKPLLYERRFFCPDCPFHPGFIRQQTLKRHIISGHGKLLRGQNSKDCGICGKPCRDRIKARRHEYSHHPASFVCSECPEIDKSRGGILRHFRLIHPTHPVPEFPPLQCVWKRFTCSECPEHPGFVKSRSLRAHIEAGHPEPKITPKRILRKPRKVNKKINYDEFGSSDDSSEDEDSWNDSMDEDEHTKDNIRRNRVNKRGLNRRIIEAKKYSKLIDKEVYIPLTRVDCEWPEIDVDNNEITVKLDPFKIDSDEHENLDPIFILGLVNSEAY